MTDTANKTLVLYDGVCPLCNRLVRFLLRRDHNDMFRFAALQSDLARRLLTAHGADPEELNTVCVVSQHGLLDEKVLTKSTAVLCALRQLGGIWRLAAVGFIVPRFLRDLLYDAIAKPRYRVFGKYDVCPLPAQKDRGKFLI